MIILDVDLRLILFLGTLAMLCLGFAIVFFVVIYQRRILKKNMAIQEIGDSLKEQELEAIYSIVDAQEKERKRIAKELHDNVGSVLATLKMYADTMHMKERSEQEQLAQEISRITEKAGNETRRISHSLNEGISEHFGFAESLFELVKTVNRLGRLQLKVNGDVESVPDSDRGIQLFRIIQELISNTVKHSGAKIAELEFIKVDGTMNLIYTDDGTGFDTQRSERGIGLSNIKSRLENIHGEMEVESEIGKGSTFSIDIPLV